jgi:hypothetical protein
MSKLTNQKDKYNKDILEMNKAIKTFKSNLERFKDVKKSLV